MSQEARNEINIAKVKVGMERKLIQNVEIKRKAGQWIPNIGIDRGQYNRYLQTMDLY